MARLRVLAAVAVFTATGCSALVEPDKALIRCEVRVGEEDPCLEVDLSCIGGFCQRCNLSVEECNGLDDDCDGRFDEGHDLDGDGFTWCGGGVLSLIDCVDSDSNIRPPTAGGLDDIVVAERCDGKDNDCDGRLDEVDECVLPNGCSAEQCEGYGLLCAASLGRCVFPLPEGSSCVVDEQCDNGFCAPPDTGGMTRCAAN